VCDLETSRIGTPYIYDISNLRVKLVLFFPLLNILWTKLSSVNANFWQNRITSAFFQRRRKRWVRRMWRRRTKMWIRGNKIKRIRKRNEKETGNTDRHHIEF
jgi:hypothetical protein